MMSRECLEKKRVNLEAENLEEGCGRHNIKAVRQEQGQCSQRIMNKEMKLASKQNQMFSRSGSP